MLFALFVLGFGVTQRVELEARFIELQAQGAELYAEHAEPEAQHAVQHFKTHAANTTRQARQIESDMSLTPSPPSLPNVRIMRLMLYSTQSREHCGSLAGGLCP